MVVLIVVKLEEDYETEDDAEEGFSCFFDPFLPSFHHGRSVLVVVRVPLHGTGAPKLGTAPLEVNTWRTDMLIAEGPKASQDVTPQQRSCCRRHCRIGLTSDAPVTSDVEAGGGETMNVQIKIDSLPIHSKLPWIFARAATVRQSLVNGNISTVFY
jgi:hypothetical protein